MKTCAILMLLTTVAWGVEREQVHRLLSEAANGQGEEYLKVRSQITGLGEDALPLLREATVDLHLTWQQRLVARIAYERVARGDEIKALQLHKWTDYPPYIRVRNERGGRDIRIRRALSGLMAPYVLTQMKEVGACYYYIEQNWKTTHIRRESGWALFDLDAGYAWSRRCREALEGQPEEIYLWRAIADRIEKEEEFLALFDNRALYWDLVQRGVTIAVPVLLSRWEEYVKNEYPNPRPNPKDRRITHLGFFTKILSFAEPQHVELLERFIAEREELLGDLRPKLEEVRRRAPKKVEEPPFRCEKKPPLEGMVKPPPGFFDPPKPPKPPPSENNSEEVIIEVN